MSVKGSITSRVWENYRWVLVLLFSIVLYAPTVSYDYTLDDAIVIYDNEFTQQGLQGIPAIFQYDTFRGFFKVEGKENLVAGGRYRPLSLALFAVEYSIVGNNPWLSHLMNVLFYALFGGLLLFFLEKNLLPRSKYTYLAFAVTMLFMAHPIHSEVVANIKGRDEILSALLGLLSLHFLIERKYIGAGVMIILALLAKEMAATWIAIAMGFFYIIKHQSIPKSITSTWPLLAGFVVYLLIRFSVIGLPAVGEPILELMNNPFLKIVDGQYVPYTFLEKAQSILFALGKYLGLLTVPFPLTHDYYPNSIPLGSWLRPWILLGIIGHLALVFLVFQLRKTKPLWSFSACFYLASLLLVSNVFFPIGTHMGERFLFMGSIGFILGLGVILYTYLPKGIQRYTFLGIFIAWTALTGFRNPVWKNDYTLFTTDVHTSAQSAKALNAAAGSLVDACIDLKGQGCDPQSLQEAEDYAQRAIAIHPNYKSAHLILGNALLLQKKYSAATSSFKMALRLDPNLSAAKKNLVIALLEEGKYLGEKQGQPKKAIVVLKEALSLDENNEEALRLLGVAHGVTQDFEKALFYFEKWLELDPQNSEALKNVGITYLQMGQEELGRSYIQKAGSIKGENEE